MLVCFFASIGVACAYPNITEINPNVMALMQEVSITNLEANIRYLQDLGTRWDQRPENAIAQKWLFEHYKNAGLDVYLHHFLPKPDGDTTFEDMGNVVAVQVGTEFPDEYIMVSSHFDSAQDGGIVVCPGANDDASGTSGVQEIARILSKHKFKRSIVYVNFNHEEMGLSGSRAFVHYCKDNDINILGVFNLDMIGYSPIGKTLEMYCLLVKPADKNFINYYVNTSNLYQPEVPMEALGDGTGGIGAGDDIMFLSNGYSAATYIGDALGMLGHIYSEPCYHRPCDTIGIGKDTAGVNSMELVRAYTQATLVAIAELANNGLTGIDDTQPNARITPNPTSGILHVATNYDQPYTLAVYNYMGQMLLQIDNFVDGELDLSVLPKGFYTIRFSTWKGGISQQIIIR